MAEATIQVEQLGKRYRIGHRRPMADGLRHVIGDTLARPFRGRMKTEEFWALRDATFDVAEGEVLGVIGANGAGKTTLLRILSRITPPTEGQARLRGRVGSLLEVGTGFHPELTGRENVFLNGAILGMRRREIKRHFDEIVAFSELERFLDTPVKRYSAGMYVRLAFAIAAHLQPEILLIDEVLAVGDVAFQKKCLGKMGQVARGGRTVLFVSHNMSAVRSLCDRAVWIDAGQSTSFDSVEDAIGRYLSALAPSAGGEWLAENAPAAPDTDVVKPLRLAVVDEAGRALSSAAPRTDQVTVELDFELKAPAEYLTLGVAVYDAAGTYLFHSLQTDGPEGDWPKLAVGRNRIRATLPIEILNEGDHRVVMLAAIHKKRWLLRPDDSTVAVSLTISGGMSESPWWQHGRRGVIAPIMPWRQAT